MAAQSKSSLATFRVLDALDAPDGGRILRLRLQSGDAPAIRDLKGARMRARSPDGEVEREFSIKGFALLGGRPSNRRLARTGKVDLHVTMDNGEGAPPVTLRWEVTGPLS
ncbi:MAG TPA: hypothetical protein VGA70_12190 [Longimicrobiales bacterium]